ncbi:unnamed protein product [Chondrus crispus]|uniref:Uncharacterized protein n=1 Tax=Chondrus crispus TaxID=2769 RepID=R7Q4K8_CHOCR|nr:unnamed protein product [Chondrus crispus]CDF32395.1 unnamed protein product [Chondrus crispus]|eukprot:XP_005712060.1 unnamed protein product [Chondrus crispus]
MIGRKPHADFSFCYADDRNWRGNLKYTFRTASYSLKGNFAALTMSETQEEFDESVSQSTANLGKVESRPSDR